jgi:regulator of sirC expression with transglutaminase-like and TPR domain
MDAGEQQFDRLAHFAELVAGDPAAVPLDRSALAMAAVLRSRPTDAAIPLLDELAVACPEPTFAGVRRFLYEDLGFAGDRRDFDHPRNSFLDVVLERRRGLPILLATVVIEVGRRAGVPLVGVGMPLHFLVRAADDADAYVDPFTGEPLDAAGARRLFDALSGGGLPWDDRHLAPTPPRLIVLRMLTNLRVSYERRADRVGVALVARMRAAIPELGEAAMAEAIRLGGVFN